jgi:subtilisin family serine protease
MPKMRHVLFLACAVPALGLCLAGSASAEIRFGRGAIGMRPSFAGHPGMGGPRTFAGLRNHGFGRMPGGGQMARGGLRGNGQHFQQHGQGGRHEHGGQHAQQHGQGGAGNAGRQQGHNNSPASNIARNGANIPARNGLLRQPYPGEAGFTGVPPQGETRFVSHEMVVHVGADVSPQALEAAQRRLGLTAITTQDLSGGRLIHFRVRGDMTDAIRTLETEKIGVAQPNYLFQLQQDTHVAALPPPKGDPAQYVIDKLHLRDAHAIASGADVTVAVIDSLIDQTHPDIAGSVSGQYDAIVATDKPDEHGTGMTGAIAAHRRLLGVAPQARILAIHAFSPDAKHPQQATTASIVAGIDWAMRNKAKIINMSFAGPYDPLLHVALENAHKSGVILVAAAGNMGPQSPPLYPAADENVIAVTAVDDKDKVLPQANQGAHVALAAPGVNVLEAAPRASYNFTTGTSVAAAHVSGVVALLLQRNRGIDSATLEQILFSTARRLGTSERDPQTGYGLVDPYRALTALEAKVVAQHSAPETTASANPRQMTSAAPVTAQVTASVSPSPPGSPHKPPPGAAELVSGAPAAPIGPATPRISAAATPAASPGNATGDGARGPAPATLPATTAALPRSEETAAIEKKREACRQAGAGQGVEASKLAGYVNVCVNEARLACLKQAGARKVRALERRDFLNRCLLGS